jgi:hypothetical protein
MSPLLSLLQPLLHLAGIDPAQVTNRLGREQLTRRMERAVPAVTRDLASHGLTPERVAGHPGLARQMVRSALYQLFKRALGFPQGGNIAADLLRDVYDDKVVARVAPQLRAAQTVEEALGLVIRELVEIVF